MSMDKSEKEFIESYLAIESKTKKKTSKRTEEGYKLIFRGFRAMIVKEYYEYELGPNNGYSKLEKQCSFVKFFRRGSPQKDLSVNELIKDHNFIFNVNEENSNSIKDGWYMRRYCLDFPELALKLLDYLESDFFEEKKKYSRDLVEKWVKNQYKTGLFQTIENIYIKEPKDTEARSKELNQYLNPLYTAKKEWGWSALSLEQAKRHFLQNLKKVLTGEEVTNTIELKLRSSKEKISDLERLIPKVQGDYHGRVFFCFKKNFLHFTEFFEELPSRTPAAAEFSQVLNKIYKKLEGKFDKAKTPRGLVEAIYMIYEFYEALKLIHADCQQFPTTN